MKFTFMCKLILKFWLKSSSVQSHFGRFRSHILVYILSPSDLWLNQPRPVDSLLQFQIFQRKKTFNFPSSMTLQSFILSILFYLCCLHLAHCDFSVFFFFFSWNVFWKDGEQLASALHVITPLRLESCYSFPYL